MTTASLPLDDHRIPPVPLLLGAGGLVPFAALALMLAAGMELGVPRPTLHAALVTYGALIASFLGGIRWGLALRLAPGEANREFLLSVVPQLLAWACLALPAPWDLRALALLLLALGAADAALVRAGAAPGWFARLRIGLSLGAGAALFIGSL